MFLSYSEEGTPKVRQYINLDKVELIEETKSVITFYMASGRNISVVEGEEAFELVKNYLINKFIQYAVN